VQDFKTTQFENGYEGLLAVKLERTQKGAWRGVWLWIVYVCVDSHNIHKPQNQQTAHERYQKALQEFAKKREAAAQEGSYVICLCVYVVVWTFD
jgi:hypothetical protein